MMYLVCVSFEARVGGIEGGYQTRAKAYSGRRAEWWMEKGVPWAEACRRSRGAGGGARVEVGAMIDRRLLEAMRGQEGSFWRGAALARMTTMHQWTRKRRPGEHLPKEDGGGDAAGGAGEGVAEGWREYS